MESSPRPGTPDDPTAVLAAADRVRERFAAGLRLPRGTFASVAFAVAVQVAAAAYGIAAQTTQGLGVALGGAAVFLGVAAVVLLRFRRDNGVREDGLASTIVLGTGATSTVVYLGAFVAATWAAFESRWWLVAIAAVVGGAAYSLSAFRWWRAYRRDPVERAGGVSPRTLVLLAVVACVGFGVLVVGS